MRLNRWTERVDLNDGQREFGMVESGYLSLSWMGLWETLGNFKYWSTGVSRYNDRVSFYNRTSRELLGGIAEYEIFCPKKGTGYLFFNAE